MEYLFPLLNKITLFLLELKYSDDHFTSSINTSGNNRGKLYSLVIKKMLSIIIIHLMMANILPL